MDPNGENTGRVNIKSILLLLFLSFTLLVCINLISNSPVKEKNSVSVDHSFNRYATLSSSAIYLPTFLKNWISLISDFKYFPLKNSPFLENNKVDVRISQLLNIRRNQEFIPAYFYRFHLFPVENDDEPLLS
jgi:hypothetical protein